MRGMADSASDRVAMEANGLGRAPKREDVCGDAQSGDSVVDDVGELPKGVGVPRRVPEGCSFGCSVCGGVT